MILFAHSSFCFSILLIYVEYYAEYGRCAHTASTPCANVSTRSALASSSDGESLNERPEGASGLCLQGDMAHVWCLMCSFWALDRQCPERRPPHVPGPAGSVAGPPARNPRLTRSQTDTERSAAVTRVHACTKHARTSFPPTPLILVSNRGLDRDRVDCIVLGQTLQGQQLVSKHATRLESESESDSDPSPSQTRIQTRIRVRVRLVSESESDSHPSLILRV
jgi:hypothetical protein